MTMPGASLSKGDVEGLKADIAAAKAPKEVLALLTGAELELLHMLDPREQNVEDAKTIFMPLVQVFRAVREHVQRNVPLPEDFPELLSGPFDSVFKSEHESDIGLIVEIDADLEAIKAWVFGKLAEINRETQDKIRNLLAFERRGWLDGPVSVEIIPKEQVPAVYWEAQTETRQELSPRQKKLQELAKRRETKELSPYDFDLNFLWQLKEAGEPLRRKDLDHQTGIQAVVLNREDFDTLVRLDFVHRTGERMQIEPESLDGDDVLILYPEDLGNAELQPEDVQLLRQTLNAEQIDVNELLNDVPGVVERLAAVNQQRDATLRDRPDLIEQTNETATRQKQELLGMFVQWYRERKQVKDDTRQKLSALLGNILGEH